MPKTFINLWNSFSLFIVVCWKEIEVNFSIEKLSKCYVFKHLRKAVKMENFFLEMKESFWMKVYRCI